MIAGIVLAAGQSRRMGVPKASLRVAGETFLERAVRVLQEGGCQQIIVVLDPDPACRQLLERVGLPGLRPAWGGGADTEQIDSLRAGLRGLPSGTEAAVVLPVDHPRVEPGTIAALIGAFRDRGAPIIVPVLDGARGHPVLFGAAVFDELLSGRPPEGARSIVHLHEDDLEEVVVSDPGVLVDVDTPGDYEDHMGEPP